LERLACLDVEQALPLATVTSGMTALADMLANGWGVPRDEAEALLLFRQAAERGNTMAIRMLAWRSETGTGMPRDTAAAVALYQRAAESGDAASQGRLAHMYMEGQGVARNDSEALRLARLAADSREFGGLHTLAMLHLKGQGVRRDRVEACRWAILAERHASSAGRNEALGQWRSTTCGALSLPQQVQAQELADAFDRRAN
jgi:TPR repeat protein